MKYLPHLVYMLPLFLLGCLGSDEQSGVETTNGITVALRQPDGSPDTSSLVQVIDGRNWLGKASLSQSGVLFTTSPDSQGEFFLHDSLKDYAANLQINGSGVGYYSLDYFSQSFPEGKDTLLPEPTGSLSGTFAPQNDYPEFLLLGGTEIRVPVDAGSGTFSASGVPPGIFPLVAQFTSSFFNEHALVGNVSLSSGGSGTATNLLPQMDVIPIDDMEDEVLDITLLGGLTGGNWFPYADSDLDGSSTSSFEQVFDSTRNGSVYQINYALQPRDPHSYGGTGINLGRRQAFNLTALDTLEFAAKGVDTLSVILRRRRSAPNEDVPTLRMTVLLTEDWQTHSLAMSDFTAAGATADEVLAQVEAIQFQVTKVNSPGETITWWVDDVKFKGLTLNVLMEGAR